MIKRKIDWKNPNSSYSVTPTNHQIKPGGEGYSRYLWVHDQIAPGSYVLDVGCNCGQLAENLYKDLGCRVVGVDIVQDFIDHCNERKSEFGRFVCADFSRDLIEAELGKVGIVDTNFDYITALEVIEHPIDVRGFRAAAYLMLAGTGGDLIITTPHPRSPQFGYQMLIDDPGHVRMWTREWLDLVFGPLKVYEELYYKGEISNIGAVMPWYNSPIENTLEDEWLQLKDLDIGKRES